jgi:uncharacterized protein (TIGR02145 family)
MKTKLFNLLFMAMLIFFSCQKSTQDLEIFVSGATVLNSDPVQGLKSEGTLTSYFGHQIFKRESGKPSFEIRRLVNPDFKCFGQYFYLHIQNGDSQDTRVSSAEIRINGNLIAGPSDFSKNIALITKQITGLTSESILEVKLNSDPGSYIDLWIEGTYNAVIPEFSKIGPYLQNSEVPELPKTSMNDIPGTWEPATINSSSVGTFNFKFTPETGHCAFPVTIEIEITDRVSDVEGNSYKVTRIGSQFWMAENLKTTKFSNGEIIETTVPANLNLVNMSKPVFQWAYYGSESNASVYGRLYTWQATIDSRGLCPSGWHVPSEGDWKVMSDYLIENGYGFEGSGDDIAKSLASKTAWPYSAIPGSIGNNPIMNNRTGFSGIRAGYRVYTGNFTSSTTTAIWWSSTASTSISAKYYSLTVNSNYLNSSTIHKNTGNSVRCIKND